MRAKDTKQPHDLLRRAKILFASGDLEKSVELFTVAEEQGCDSVDVWLSRGAARMALGRYVEARDDFSRVIAEDTKNERAYYFRGIAHIAIGEFEQAVDDLTSSLKRNNGRGIAHLMRGLAYAELGQESDAVLDINSASAFSEAEIGSFNKLFGDIPGAFRNTKDLLARENAPWRNLLSQKSAKTLFSLFQ